MFEIEHIVDSSSNRKRDPDNERIQKNEDHSSIGNFQEHVQTTDHFNNDNENNVVSVTKENEKKYETNI